MRFEICNPTNEDRSSAGNIVKFFLTTNGKYCTIYKNGRRLWPCKNRSLDDICAYCKQFGFETEEVCRALKKCKVGIFYCPDIKKPVVVYNGKYSSCSLTKKSKYYKYFQ